MAPNKDLVAASATPLVLAVLRGGDSYGYAIITQVRAASGNNLEWNEGMLYPLLHRLTARGFIEQYESAPDGARARKYYRLLPAGRAHLERESREFLQVSEKLTALLNPTTGVSHA